MPTKRPSHPPLSRDCGRNARALSLKWKEARRPPLGACIPFFLQQALDAICLLHTLLHTLLYTQLYSLLYALLHILLCTILYTLLHSLLHTVLLTLLQSTLLSTILSQTRTAISAMGTLALAQVAIYVYIVYTQSTYWYSLVLSCTLDATIYILVLTTAPRLAALSLPLENLKSGHNICIQPMVFLGSGHRERRGIWWWCHPRGCLGVPDVATSAATWTEERHHCHHSSRCSSVEQEVVAWK